MGAAGQGTPLYQRTCSTSTSPSLHGDTEAGGDTWWPPTPVPISREGTGPTAPTPPILSTPQPRARPRVFIAQNVSTARGIRRPPPGPRARRCRCRWTCSCTRRSAAAPRRSGPCRRDAGLWGYIGDRHQNPLPTTPQKAGQASRSPAALTRSSWAGTRCRNTWRLGASRPAAPFLEEERRKGSGPAPRGHGRAGHRDSPRPVWIDEDLHREAAAARHELEEAAEVLWGRTGDRFGVTPRRDAARGRDIPAWR